MLPTRRTLLAVAALGPTMLGAEDNRIPIIDTHFHLYDQTRPQGAPYPFTPNNPPYLPSNFREQAKPLGIVGGIEVEASPWLEDNLWVLMEIQNEPMIVGTVGNIDPAKSDFQEYLDRFHRNKLFLGIRYGNVWKGQDLVTAIQKPEVIENMKAFAQTGLTLEVANPRLDLIEPGFRSEAGSGARKSLTRMEDGRTCSGLLCPTRGAGSVIERAADSERNEAGGNAVWRGGGFCRLPLQSWLGGEG